MKQIDVPIQNDVHDESRKDYSDILKNQLEKGNNGLVRTKFVTFGIETDSAVTAKQRLERIETDIWSSFKSMGAETKLVNGVKRLGIMHGLFNPNGNEKLNFSFDDIPKTGVTAKDAISPTSFNFGDAKVFKMGDWFGAASYLQITAPDMIWTSCRAILLLTVMKRKIC